MHLSRVVATAVALSAGCSIAAMQAIAETVGKAVSVKTMVTGDRGELKRADPVSRDERIRTNNIGLGQFQFIDGTKFAVGLDLETILRRFDRTLMRL